MKPAQFIYKTATPRSKVQFLVNAWTHFILHFKFNASHFR